MKASVQYDDMTGSAALDDGDFESFGSLLGLAEWIVLGIEVSAFHPSLGIEGKSAADRSHSYLTVWAIHETDLPETGGLPALFASGTRVPLTEFAVSMADSTYPAPVVDGVGLLLRASKRFNLVLWHRTVCEAQLTDESFDLVGERELRWASDHWEEHEPS